MMSPKIIHAKGPSFFFPAASAVVSAAFAMDPNIAHKINKSTGTAMRAIRPPLNNSSIFYSLPLAALIKSKLHEGHTVSPFFTF
jgi:hypothetical protein